MRRGLILLAIFICHSAYSQNQADEFYDATAMQNARDMIKKTGGGQSNYLVLVDQLEYRAYEQEDSLVLDAQAWIGTDENKFWVKTEGHYDLNNNNAENFELQALYSKAISPFWDIQLGLRHDFEPNPNRAYGVLGLQGLAPYWLEVDAALFVSEKGKLSTRLKAEYDMHLTQRLILQPRVELNAAFSDDRDIRIGQGMSEAQVGFRFRYEVKREIAPYLGISWGRAFGETGFLLNRAGQDNEQFSIVAGIRLWY